MFEKASEKYKDGEFKLVVAKAIDQYEFCKKRNKIEYTDFLTRTEVAILEKVLKEEHIENYMFYGAREDADRCILVFYPEKLSIDMVNKNLEKILDVIRVVLPDDMHYEHKEMLSGIMKLGIKREKFGDIIITPYGADIIALNESSKYLLDGMKELTRFRKSKITIENINDLYEVKQKFQDLEIIVSSIRLDNIVSEIARTSRTKAKELIEEGLVFVNSLNETNSSKKISINDIINVRGKGKFIFEEIIGQTRSDRIRLKLKKYM